MTLKRPPSVAAGNGFAAPPEKRPRMDDGGIPAPAQPPSPGRRLLRQTVLVILFLIRAQDRSTGDMDFSLSQIGRVVREQIRHCLRPIFSKLESMEGRICALTQKVDNITCNSCKGHNNKRHMKEPNQQGNSARTEGLATNENKGKRARIRLQFLNAMKPLIYHEDEIKSNSDSAIRIGIFDGNSVIRSGQLSKLKIEILALNGDFPYDDSDVWTSEEFNKYRVGGQEGKGNVLTGKCTVRLINGEVELNNIKFIKGSCAAPNKMFIVGARVCDSEQVDGRIQEAVMNPVVVQDRRNKSNEKSHPPKLHEKVHRLEEIANGGTYCRRLGEKNVVTVQDFLKALNRDPDNLVEILQIKKHHQAWKKMVKHAQECCLEGNHKLKSYHSAERNVVLFFNCVDLLVGAKFGDLYSPSDMFDPVQQDLVDRLKKLVNAEFDGLIEDHVMTDKGPVPINMNADAGPLNATQKKCSAHYTTYQGEGASVVAGSTHAQVEQSCANANNNDVPSTSNFQCMETEILVQEQLLPASLNGCCQGLLGQPDYSVGTLEDLCRFAQDPEYTSNCGSTVLCDYAIEQEPTRFVAPGFNHTLEQATAAHSNMALTMQQLVGNGDPGMVAQGRMQVPLETSLGNSANISHDHPQGQWCHFQGNMP